MLKNTKKTSQTTPNPKHSWKAFLTRDLLLITHLILQVSTFSKSKVVDYLNIW